MLRDKKKALAYIFRAIYEENPAGKQPFQYYIVLALQAGKDNDSTLLGNIYYKY